MRALIGLLLLLSAFALAASLQESHTRALRRQRDMRRSQPALLTEMAGPHSEGWNLLVVGRPSGVDPLPYPELGWATGAKLARRLEVERRQQEPPAFEDSTRLLSADSGGEEHTGLILPSADEVSSDLEPEFVYRIQSGDVLGEICSGHYGTARPALVQAVAEYNGLGSADDIREGDLLYLPDPSGL